MENIEKNTDKILLCGLTQQGINELKLKHGSLVAVNITEEEQTYHVIFKEPTFKILEVINATSKKDEMGAMSAAYHNLVVVADDSVNSRDILKIKAVEALMLRVQKVTANAKNL